jgi:AcrR family transcriptional regulator
VAQVVERTAADRREAILDVAERLIRTKGYERMSIQEIQDELEISRGAVYHYFGSKEDLLWAVLERTSEAITAVLEPIAHDRSLPADVKLQQVFLAAGQWKTERRELMRRLVDVWMSDDNAVARLRLRRISSQKLRPLLEAIIREGEEDGAFTVGSPGHTARVLADLLQAAGETAAELLLEQAQEPRPFVEIQQTFEAYDEAIERVLGLPPDSFDCMDEPTIRAWFASARPRKEYP